MLQMQLTFDIGDNVVQQLIEVPPFDGARDTFAEWLEQLYEARYAFDSRVRLMDGKHLVAFVDASYLVSAVRA